MATYLEKIGENVRRARRRLGISQEELAIRSGLDNKTIVDLELGKRNPTLATLRKVALALRVGVADLVS